MEQLSRRSFLQIGAATGVALALGPARWGWAVEGSPFAELQDDPLLRLPKGFSYKIVAETGHPLLAGDHPYPRPQFPDLNVVFPQPDGKLLLSTSHEVPSFFPLPVPPPPNDYDNFAGGAITSLLLNRDLSVAEGRYNAGGMLTNCSGSGTQWGTVLTGEEEQTTLENEHGFIWEVDPHHNTKTRLDSCGKFDHETAVVDPNTGYVYLTQDEGSALLYRMRPNVLGRLAEGGALEAYRADGTWVPIADPLGRDRSTFDQGREQGALRFRRLEGGRFDGRDFYFTETEDDTACGKVWRLDVRTNRLDLFAEGRSGGPLCMPDNLALDAAGNLFVTEDKSDASSENPNRVVFIDRRTGDMASFAELALEFSTPEENVADEPTGPEFSPDGSILFLNLQHTPDFGMTLAITGPFARWTKEQRRGRAVAPRAALPAEAAFLGAAGERLTLPMGAAAALVHARRRGRTEELPRELEGVAEDLGSPPEVERPKRRVPKTY